MQKRLLPTASLLLAVPALLVGLAACSPSGSSSGVAPTPNKTASEQDWQLAQAKCMRDAGHDVPDPDSSGHTQIALGDGDTPEKFFADSKKCDAAVTKKLGKRPVSDEAKQAAPEEKKTDDCLRKNGIDIQEGQAYNTDEITPDIQKKCGLELPAS